jgi:hypothetical protein
MLAAPGPTSSTAVRADQLRDDCLRFRTRTRRSPGASERQCSRAPIKLFASSALAADPRSVSLKYEPALAKQLQDAHPSVHPRYHLQETPLLGRRGPARCVRASRRLWGVPCHQVPKWTIGPDTQAKHAGALVLPFRAASRRPPRPVASVSRGEVFGVAAAWCSSGQRIAAAHPPGHRRSRVGLASRGAA